MMQKSSVSFVPSTGSRLAGSVAALLLTLAIAAAPLWGLPDPSDSVLLICYFSLVTTGFLADLPRTWLRVPAEQPESGSLYFRTALVGGLLLLLMQWSSIAEVCVFQTQPITSITLAGLAIAICGCGIRMTAVATLGESFVSGPHGCELVTTGIYRYLRHPSELGLLLICAGLVLALGAWRSAVVFGPLVLLTSFIRMQEEERWLLRCKSDLYAGYRERTGRLLPKFSGF